MRILGIETSCDETAVCLVEARGDFGADFSFEVLGNALHSQASLHAEYGGVFPNVAKREHAKHLAPLLMHALDQAGELQPSNDAFLGELLIPLKELLAREPELFASLIPYLAKFKKPAVDAIAVTNGPGLEPALWVGINFAKALSIIWGVPLVGVNHMEGHVVLSMMDDGMLKSFDFPALALLISGGHTELVFSKAFGAYERIGETRDDAAGEAFDKVARLLDLPYPGGPHISKLAAEARAEAIESQFHFTPPMLKSKDYDFSFSGLKTEVRKIAEANSPLSQEMKKQIALAFENAVAEVLVAKTIRAVEEYGASAVVVGGGVSANAFIREKLQKALSDSDASAQLLIPPAELATDNALMIALAGYFHARDGRYADLAALSANGNLKLENRA